MTIHSRIAFALVVAALAIGEHDALAAPAEMTRLFEQGRALVKEGQFEQAIPKFLASLAVEPSVGALLNLGDCYERLGKPASARRRFIEAAALAGEADAARSAEATARAARLANTVGRIVIVRRGRSEGLDVAIDAEPLSPRADRVEVDPGTHEILITFADATRERRSVAVRSGQLLEVIVESPTAKPATVVATAPDPPPPPIPEGNTAATQRALGIGSGAVGAVALGVGVTFGVIAMGKRSDLGAACPNYPRCPDAQRAPAHATYDDASRSSTIATISILGGGVLLATAVVLWLTAPEKKPTLGAPAVLTPARGGFRGALTF